MNGSRVVIVGASLAGATAAFTLRDEGFDGQVVLVGEEATPPYERPPLSKELLRGEAGLERAIVRPVDAYEAAGIELRLGTAALRVDPGSRQVELADGSSLAYDAVVVATGGRPRRLAVPGGDLESVFTLRRVEDAERIREAAQAGARAVVVGMGFVGAEVAASLVQLGVEVAAVELLTPFAHVLGDEVAAVVTELHREHGVELHLGEAVTAFEGDRRVGRVVTSGGRSLPCDFAVVGVGIAPNVEVVAGSGVEIDNGIVVDELGRTRADGVFAAGDVARYPDVRLGHPVRIEHWQHAIRHAQAVARAVLGKGEPYAETPWFWSDQYDANLQVAGLPESWDELVVRGSLEDRSFVAFYLARGRMEAAAALNRGRDLRRAVPLVAARAEVPPELLQDEDTDLRELAQQ
jgi:3-phenylpropionate/trans-cinnamate dioxygenase ferredoxin reductase subunit